MIKKSVVITFAIISVTLVVGAFLMKSFDSQFSLKTRESYSSNSFYPQEFLSPNQIGQCINTKEQTCHDISDNLIKNTQGKNAQKQLMERLKREQNESSAYVRACIKSNGSLPTPDQMKAAFEDNHFLDGPTAPIWNCRLGVYTECYESENSNSSDSGNSNTSNFNPVSATPHAIASFIPYEFLSRNQIGQCINPQLQTCDGIAQNVIQNTKGQKAQKQLIERFKREDHDISESLREYEEENGTIATPELLKEGFQEHHLLDGPTAPIWNCFLGIYIECYEYDNSHPDEVPSDSGNSNSGDFIPVSATPPHAISSFIPFELLSFKQIDDCIISKNDDCHDMANNIYRNTEGKEARQQLMERFRKEDQENDQAIQQYVQEHGTVPSLEIMKAGFEERHFLDGPTAPYWNCYLGIYNECYDSENSHPDEIPSDSANSDESDIDPKSQ